MKTKSEIKSAVLLSLLIAPLAAFAQTSDTVYRIPPVESVQKRMYEDAYVAAHRDVGLLSVRSLNANSGSYAGQHIELKFTIDERGVPHNIGVIGGTPDMGLAVMASNALRDWRFEPGSAPREGTVMMKFVTDRSSEPIAQLTLNSGGQSYALR